jgi:hypothetical protein
MVHVLQRVKTEIDTTHPGLGRLAAFSLIATRARKCLLVISPSGFGKSASSESIADLYPQRLRRIDAASMASLSKRETELNGFNGLVVVDDLTKAQTTYSKVATISTLAELTYSHFVDRSMGNQRVNIQDFHAATIINIQPVWFKEIATAPEWDAVVREKCIRYYHLIRPTKPNTTIPKLTKISNHDVDTVKANSPSQQLYDQIDDIASSQWSDARINEHIPMLLKATASLDNRSNVNDQDAKILIELMRPMTLERYVLRSMGFETDREYDSNALYVYAELATNRKANIKAVQRNYKFSKSQAYSIIQNLSNLVYLSPKRSGKLIPTKQTKQVLKEAGYYG